MTAEPSPPLSMDDTDRTLLDRLQASIPLVPQPFAAVAAELGLREKNLLDRLKRLRGPGGPVRTIAAVFDAGVLGYRSTLVAARVAPEQIDPAAAVIGEHPGVTHCYQRDHEFNLWFTLTVPPDTALGLDATIEQLAERSGVRGMLSLPAVRTFKIGLFLPQRIGMPTPAPQPASAAAVDLTDEHRTAVRALARELPLVPHPFAAMAVRAGMPDDRLLERAGELAAGGALRRVAVLLSPTRAGFPANRMVAWAMPEAAIEAAGRRLAGLPEVSHCYQRRTAPEWTFALFAMMHGRNAGQLR